MNIQPSASGNKESRIDTHCLGCVFEKDEEGNQIDCRLGAINKFKLQNVEIVLDKGSARIIGRICPFYRNKWWQENIKNGENALDKVRKEATLRYDLIIITRDLDKLQEILSDVTILTIQPKNLFVVSGKIRLAKLGKLLVDLKLNVKWRTEYLLKQDSNSDWTAVDIIDYIAGKCKSSYFAVIQDGGVLDDTRYTGLDKLINDELLPVIIQKDDDSYDNAIYSRHAWNLTKNITGLEQWCKDTNKSR